MKSLLLMDTRHEKENAKNNYQEVMSCLVLAGEEYDVTTFDKDTT